MITIYVHTPSSMMYLFLSTLSRSIQKRHLFHFIKHVMPKLSIMLAGSLHSSSQQSTKEQTDPSIKKKKNPLDVEKLKPGMK